MKRILRVVGFMCVGLGLAWACARNATARPEQEMLPEQSAAKAKQVLQQVISALGGQAYLNVRDTQCEGRTAQFGTAGTLMGFTLFRDLWLLPDKNRVEYLTKGEHTILGFFLGTDDLLITHGGAMVTVYNGKGGWSLDKSGVSEQTEDLIKNFNEQVKSGMNNMLRKRMREPGIEVHYAGTDLIDLKEAEWIEFTDSDRREMRLGLDRFSHLPVRWEVSRRDPESRERIQFVTSYTQYMLLDGVKTPLSIELSRNDRKMSQTFLTSCKYNSNLSPEIFTRADLEQHAAEFTKKGYKDSKNTK